MTKINYLWALWLMIVSGTAEAGLAVAPPQDPTKQVVIEGLARVIDGDTIDIGGTSIRLAGIDSVERNQACTRDGAVWACGEAATDWLERFIAGASVRCTPVRDEPSPPLIANCYNAGGVQLGWAMVNWGFALNDRLNAPNFGPSERQAKAGKRGIWSGDFLEPVVWRRSGI